MATLAYTPLEEIEKIRAELQVGFNSGKTKSIAFRKYQLLQFAYLIQDNVKAFEDALASDLGRHVLESNLLEINGSIAELMEAYKNVDSWAKPEKPSLAINWMFMRPVMYKEPKGVVLIISPFNFPLWLCVSPMAGAIAAGNAIVLKPSEACPAIAALFAELIPKYLDPSLVRVVNGAIPETTKLLELPWGHILYTGSGRIGRVVATAAAKTLTPISLELGGKSPVFVDPASDMQLAARRILWGKFTNGGQTCIAPDYVLVPKAAQDDLVDAMKTAYANFYPETTGDSPTPPQNVTKMVHQAAFKRVHGLVQNTKGTIVVGGEADEATKFIAPTIVKDVKPDDSLMSEEIFGPVLPIVPVEDLDSGLAYVNSHDHPLALYVFSQNEAYKNKVFNNTQSGSAVANETIVSAGVTGLPFGGIGPSGSGYHTGKFGFQMFTHYRSSIDAPGWLDKILGFRFPPYTDSNSAKLKARLGIKLPARPTGPPAVAATGDGGAGRKWFLLAFAVAILGALTKLKNRLAVVQA
ncbi:NAD-aldehyde dehydrogenase [Mycena albidolilacea]|uniref:Aldehyde dehydrogenase n=1 Tax=Mycena albidolilacea TaxID=1033008 RepID=A0AAD7EBZ5_9AGAR|nr:NAD-aldehyde dehydrogenase [Mycena albidolilacea]